MAWLSGCGPCGVEKCRGVALLSGCGHCGVSDRVRRIHVAVASVCFLIGSGFESRPGTLGGLFAEQQ